MKLSISMTGGAIAAALSMMLVTAAPAAAGDDPKVAAEVMALARATWADDIAGKSAEVQNASLADDYTEFNPDYPTRLDGKALSTKMLAAYSGDKSVYADMQNAKVQVYGDTAILTYNYVGMLKGADGNTKANSAKSTRVYVKQQGAWRLVHANFAPVSAGN
jgi:ketosteroid isomerase-like protein